MTDEDLEVIQTIYPEEIKVKKIALGGITLTFVFNEFSAVSLKTYFEQEVATHTFNQNFNPAYRPLHKQGPRYVYTGYTVVHNKNDLVSWDRFETLMLGEFLDGALFGDLCTDGDIEFIDKIRQHILEILAARKALVKTPAPQDPAASDFEMVNLSDDTANAIPIHSTDPITVKKSTFQAHHVKIESASIIPLALSQLKRHPKIEKATHNMFAYRFRDPKTGCIVSDFDDDGEKQAGKRLLHMLNILDAQADLVIVTRWYSGPQLGPERFKLISNVARDALQQFLP